MSSLGVTLPACFAMCTALSVLRVQAPLSRACKFKQGLAALFASSVPGIDHQLNCLLFNGAACRDSSGHWMLCRDGQRLLPVQSQQQQSSSLHQGLLCSPNLGTASSRGFSSRKFPALESCAEGLPADPVRNFTIFSSYTSLSFLLKSLPVWAPAGWSGCSAGFAGGSHWCVLLVPDPHLDLGGECILCQKLCLAL